MTTNRSITVQMVVLVQRAGIVDCFNLKTQSMGKMSKCIHEPLQEKVAAVMGRGWQGNRSLQCPKWSASMEASVVAAEAAFGGP